MPIPTPGILPTRDAEREYRGGDAGRASQPVSLHSPAKGDKNVDFSFFYPMTLKVFDPNFTTPSAYNYNFTVQRELPPPPSCRSVMLDIRGGTWRSATISTLPARRQV